MVNEYYIECIKDKGLLKYVVDLYDNERPHISISNLTPNHIHETGTKIKQKNNGRIIDVFSSTMEKNPHRVVIHKRNYFMEEEKRGLVDSLKGNAINEVDLIEINFDDSSRFVPSEIINGQPEINGYPVTRGTCIIANKFEALLWTQGVVPALNKSSYSFYLGGRFIPCPLRIIKHYGKSNIGIIANERTSGLKVIFSILAFRIYSFSSSSTCHLYLILISCTASQANQGLEHRHGKRQGALSILNKDYILKTRPHHSVSKTICPEDYLAIAALTFFCRVY